MIETEIGHDEAHQDRHEEHHHEDKDQCGKTLEHDEDHHHYSEYHLTESQSSHSHHHEIEDEQLTFDSVEHAQEKEHESSIDHEPDSSVNELEQKTASEGVKESLIAPFRTPVHDALIEQFKSLRKHESDHEQFTFDDVEQVHEEDDKSTLQHDSELPVEEPDYEGDDEYFAFDKAKRVDEKEDKSRLQSDLDIPINELEYEEQHNLEHRGSESSHEQRMTTMTSTTNEFYDQSAVAAETPSHDDTSEHDNDNSLYMRSMFAKDQHYHPDSALPIATQRHRGTNEQVEIRTQMHSSSHSTLVRSYQRPNEDIPPDTGAVKQLLRNFEKRQYNDKIYEKPYKKINIFESLDNTANDEAEVSPAVPLKESHHHQFHELRYRDPADISNAAANLRHRDHREVNVGGGLVEKRSEVVSKQSYQLRNKTPSAPAAHKASPAVHNYTPSSIQHYTAPATSPKVSPAGVPMATARGPRSDKFNSIRVVRNVRDFVKAYGRKVGATAQQRAVTHSSTSREPTAKAPVPVADKRGISTTQSYTSPTQLPPYHHETDVPCCYCSYLMHVQQSQQQHHNPAMVHGSHMIPMLQHNNVDVHHGATQHSIEPHTHSLYHLEMGRHLYQHDIRTGNADHDEPFKLVPVSERRAAYEKESKRMNRSNSRPWKA